MAAHLTPVTEPEGRRGFIDRCLSGQAELWKAFWLLGFLSGLAWLPSLFMGVVGGVGGAILLGLLLGVPAQFIWSISVWRNAFHSSHWGWAIVARVWVVGVTIELVLSWISIFTNWRAK